VDHHGWKTVAIDRSALFLIPS